MKSSPHTTLASAMIQWFIFNCNQTLQANFLAFWNDLVSQVSGYRLDKTLELLKVHLLEKRSWLMKPLPFLLTFKNLSLVCKLHTSPVTLTVNDIIDHHHCTRNITGTNFQLIPFLEVEILVGGREILVYTPYPLLSPYYPLYAHYSSNKMYIQIR